MKRQADFGGFNLRHLRYFLAVCETGSFRAASAKLNIAQSAISRRVADLERALQVQLLERHARGIRATDAGAALRESSAQILAEMDAAYTALERNAAGEEGVIRIGMFGTTSRLAFVPELIARCRSLEPTIRLELSPLPQGQVDEGALSAVDLAFFEGPQQPIGHSGGQCLYAGDYVLALPHGHRLAAQPGLSLSEVAAEELIAFPRFANPVTHDRLAGEAARRGQALNIIHETESECSRLAFAAAGMGLALASPLAINHDQKFAVEYRPLTDFNLPFELWSSRRAQAFPVVDRLAVIAAELLGELPALDRSRI